MNTGRVLSIGHGGRTWDDLLHALGSVDVRYLIDVRSVPHSRHQPDFSRAHLETLTSSALRYVFMGDLLGGRPDDLDCYSDGHVDYTKVRSKAYFTRGISRLVSAHTQGFTVCLLCSEGKPSQCHRTKLIGVALAEQGIDVEHILPSGVLQPQAEVMRELLEQTELFGSSPLRSRRAYR